MAQFWLRKDQGAVFISFFQAHPANPKELVEFFRCVSTTRHAIEMIDVLSKLTGHYPKPPEVPQA